MSVPKIEWRDDPDREPGRRIADIGPARLLVQFCDAAYTKDGAAFWRWDVLTDDQWCWGADVREERTAINRCEALGILIWKAAQYDAAQKHEGSK
jgi:hypothetical protein